MQQWWQFAIALVYLAIYAMACFFGAANLLFAFGFTNGRFAGSKWMGRERLRGSSQDQWALLIIGIFGVALFLWILIAKKWMNV